MSIGKNELVISENLVISQELNNSLSALLAELLTAADDTSTADSTTSSTTICNDDC